MTYLELSGCEVGLLINFNVARLTDGVRRVCPRIPSTKFVVLFFLGVLGD
jgi:hypothetical protein